MKKNKKAFTALAIAIGVFAAHFLMDIYKIGIKDGKATKETMQKNQKPNK